MHSYNKYKNIITEMDGIKFSSIKEANRFAELKLLEKAGKIRDLKIHEPFELQEGFTDNDGKKQRPIIYESDFYYYDLEKKCSVVEDVKSEATRKIASYRIKKKMFMYKFQRIKFREV